MSSVQLTSDRGSPAGRVRCARNWGPTERDVGFWGGPVVDARKSLQETLGQSRGTRAGVMWEAGTRQPGAKALPEGRGGLQLQAGDPEAGGLQLCRSGQRLGLAEQFGEATLAHAIDHTGGERLAALHLILGELQAEQALDEQVVGRRLQPAPAHA